MLRLSRLSLFSAFALFGALQVQATDVLSTTGFASCSSQDSDIIVRNFMVEYDRSNMTVKFDVGGESKRQQEVIADLVVTAYGREVYRQTFDPCEKGIRLLCPIPAGNFSATGKLPIPQEFASQIPAIAFTIPDLDGLARLELRAKNGTDGGPSLACLQSSVRNGKTAEQPAVTWVTAGIAGAAAIIGSISLIGSAAAGAGASGGGSSGPSPNIVDVVLWFQFVSTNGMLSVNYPPVYRAFTKNFAWSTGLIPWNDMQRSIDQFRAKTGGNVTKSSFDLLRNTTLVYTSDVSSSNLRKRAVDLWGSLLKRAPLDLETSINGTTLGSSSVNPGEQESGIMKQVHGIEAYVETLSIPNTNTFMTVLLIFLIVLAGVAVLILLFKLILELYALCGKLNKPLASFRKRYWTFLLGTMVRIILLMYGIWVIYCLYQFKRGDSWAANILAGVTLAVFTAVLVFFVFRVTKLARKAKELEAKGENLLEDKSNLRKYGLFYDQYKSTFWWMFIPFIVYLFAKGAVIALGSGNGLVQSSGQLACELILFAFLVIGRPFNSKSGNVINIFIAVVRVISVACVLIFTEQLRISQTTTTVTGVVLIVVQSLLTGLLAILIAVNAIIICCKTNYYTKRRHDREKLAEEAKIRDGFNPHDRRASMMGPNAFGNTADGKGKYQPTPTRDEFHLDEMYPPPRGTYMPPPHDRDGSPVPHPYGREGHERSFSDERSFSGERQMDYVNNSRQSLIGSAAPMSHQPMHNRFPPTSYDEYRGNQQW